MYFLLQRMNFSLFYKHQFYPRQFFRPHYGPGVDSASERNEYLEYFLGVKVAGA
jgi:hypothetical protein